MRTNKQPRGDYRHSMQANDILKNKKPPGGRWHYYGDACVCQLCNQPLARLTRAHCDKHGMSMEDMIKAGHVRFIRRDGA